MSFIPLNPSYSGVLFDVLAYILSPKYDKDVGYAMTDTTIASWARLKDALVKCTSILTKKWSLAAIRPPCPWCYGYHHIFKAIRHVFKQYTIARDWFSIWMGLFSYVIVWAQTEEKEMESTAIPCWFQILADAGYDQAFLNGLRFSTVCSFLPKTQRAGAFVHLTPENKARQLQDIPRSPDSSHMHILPICLSGYQFTLKDYEAYRRQCC